MASRLCADCCADFGNDIAKLHKGVVPFVATRAMLYIISSNGEFGYEAVLPERA